MKKEKEYKDDSYVISAIEGKDMMDEDNSVILLDVRTKEEYMHEHIENSILVPVSEMFESILSICPDKDQAYLIYCRSGVRSVYARQIMKHLGYHHVFDMGGIIDWPYNTISDLK
jgi:phage shock protein E